MQEDSSLVRVDDYSVLASELVESDGEARLSALVLGERLGLARPRAILQTIERNLSEVKRYGSLPQSVANSGVGRPGTDYLLNRMQALAVCQLSEAPRAPEVREVLVRVFDGVVSGSLVSAQSVAFSERRHLALMKEAVTDVVAPVVQAAEQRIVTRFDQRFEQLEGSNHARHKEVLKAVGSKREPLSEQVKKAHRLAIREEYGGKCPACLKTEVVNSSFEVVSAEYEHFFQRHEREFKDTWIICNSCHDDKSYKRRSRNDFRAFFDSYQARTRTYRPDSKRMKVVQSEQKAFGFARGT